MMLAFDKLSLRIVRPDGVRRLGQALWMLAGGQVDASAMLWAKGPLGPDGDLLLWTALVENGCIDQPAGTLNAGALCSFLRRLWNPVEARPTRSDGDLVWTLPSGLEVGGVQADSYVQEAVLAISQSSTTVLLVSPYLEPRGVGRLVDALLEALARSVSVTVITHEADDLSSLASLALKQLRRESVGLSGRLAVFTAAAMPRVLLHSKILACDGKHALVGSANVTGKGFGHNLEAGVVLGEEQAREIERVLQTVIAKGLVKLAFAA